MRHRWICLSCMTVLNMYTEEQINLERLPICPCGDVMQLSTGNPQVKKKDK